VLFSLFPFFPFSFSLLTFSSFQQKPIIVKIVEPKEDSLYDVLFGALGLTGVMVLIAVAAAVVFGAVLFWVRSRPRE
jgi:hypothetical protein